MDEQLEAGLQNILQKNKVVWGVVLTGMIGLLVISIVLYYLNVIGHLPIVHPEKADNVTLFVILLIVLTIFFIKQTILSPAKLIEKAKKPNVVLNDPLVTLTVTGDENRTTFLKCVQILNRNILIVWFLADSVVIVSLVSFILVPVLNKFVLYSLVGLFSLLINFPNMSIYKKIYRYIYE